MGVHVSTSRRGNPPVLRHHFAPTLTLLRHHHRRLGAVAGREDAAGGVNPVRTAASPPVPSASAAADDDHPESVPEDVVESAVQDEIRRRVDGQQQIGYLAHAAHEVVALVVTESEDGRHDGVRSDAHDEDGDDGHEHDGDSVAVRDLASRGRSTTAGSLAGSTEGVDDETVEDAEDRQRHE